MVKEKKRTERALIPYSMQLCNFVLPYSKSMNHKFNFGLNLKSIKTQIKFGVLLRQIVNFTVMIRHSSEFVCVALYSSLQVMMVITVWRISHKQAFI